MSQHKKIIAAGIFTVNIMLLDACSSGTQIEPNAIQDNAVSKQNIEINKTGMVYRHEHMGIFPVGHDSLTVLRNVNVRKEDDFEATKYQFYPNSVLDMSELSKNETKILDAVILKFRNFSDRNLVEYVNQEIAYKQTDQHDMIPYSLAKKIHGSFGL